MDIRQLRYFLAVAKEGQITRAAKKLNMAQPPLSQMLKLMEEELGTSLLERNGKSIQLTEAGKTLYERAENILYQFEDAIVAVQETGEGLRGELSFGTLKSYGTSHLPHKILEFRNRYPLVSYKIWEADPRQIGKYLENRDIEFGIVRYPLDVQMSFNKITLVEEPFVLFVPEQWEIAQEKNFIRMEELKDIPLMMIHSKIGTRAYHRIREEFKKSGFKPNIIGECMDASVLLSMVAFGVGAAILPKSTLYSFSTERIKMMDIIDCSLQSELVLIWSQNRPLSKIANRFIETFQTD